MDTAGTRSTDVRTDDGAACSRIDPRRRGVSCFFIDLQCPDGRPAAAVDEWIGDSPPGSDSSGPGESPEHRSQQGGAARADDVRPRARLLPPRPTPLWRVL